MDVKRRQKDGRFSTTVLGQTDGEVFQIHSILKKTYHVLSTLGGVVTCWLHCIWSQAPKTPIRSAAERRTIESPKCAAWSAWSRFVVFPIYSTLLEIMEENTTFPKNHAIHLHDWECNALLRTITEPFLLRFGASTAAASTGSGSTTKPPLLKAL